MDPKYKNSYKVNKKELVSLSVYNVGFQKCEPLYQWGPGIRDHWDIWIHAKLYTIIAISVFTTFGANDDVF